jgi:hypothetical protein
VLAVVEVGVAVGLVMFTFMLLSLFAAAREITFGFEGEGLLVAEVRKTEQTAAADLPRRLPEELGAVPGITHVAIGDLPYGGAAVRVERTGGGREVAATEVHADGAYFATLRLPLRRGRTIDEHDLAGTAPVAVVGEALAERLWPESDPLGKTVQVSREGRTETLTIVGVSTDALRLGRLQNIEASTSLKIRHVLYRPWAQSGPRPIETVVARVRGPAALLVPRIRAALQTGELGLRVRRVAALGPTLDSLALNNGGQSFVAALQLGFSVLALLLAVVGVFGVMRQAVDERRAEFGVRLALGASPGSLVRSVVGDGLIRVGVGAGTAVVLVAALTHSAFSGLLSLSVTDPRLWLGMIAAVGLTGAAACYLPSRRAAQVDPAEVLRCE